MAKNFRIDVHAHGNSVLTLELRGDFDGGSACELLRVLTAQLPGYPKVAIGTTGLKTIHPFGRDLFARRLAGLLGPRRQVELTGCHRRAFPPMQ